MSPDVQLTLQFLVGLTFLASSVNKIVAPALFFDGLRDYQMLPSRSVGYFGVTLIAIESVIATSYLIGWLMWPVAAIALVLLGVFLVITTMTLKRGARVRCLCFGASDAELVSVRSVVRILLLAGLLVVVTLAPESERSFSAPDSYRRVLLALSCAALLQILTSWALALPELTLLINGCRGCEQRARAT